MIAYLIKSVLCLLVLWAFYKIALEQQSAHVFKRFYLLASLSIAMILPLVTITFSVPALPQQTAAFSYFVPQQTTAAQLMEPKINWLPIFLWVIYGTGVLVFGFRFLRNIGQIRSKIRQNVHVFTRKSVHVLVGNKILPHTFLRYIFFPKTEYETHQIPPEILRHEQAHVTQKHTLDILFIEILQAVFWFNPLLYFIKKSIALNHEFLADQKAITHEEDLKNYINILFNHAQGAHHAPMTSAFNYSFTARPPFRRTKKRILMISQPFSAKKLATRLVFLVPILALCIYFFNQEIVAKPVVQKQQEKQTSQKPYVYESDNVIPKNLIVKQKDLDRYAPNLGTEVLEKNVPTHDQFKEWQNTSKYGIWINGKRVKNSRLASKTNSDFDHYFISKLEKNATDYGKYHYQVDLMSPEYYDAHRTMQMLPTIDQIREYLTLKIEVLGKDISVNDNIISIENFAQTIDKITADWSEEDMMNYSVQIQFNKGTNDFMGKLNEEFHKTKLYKTNPSKELLPPPPPPPPPAPASPAQAPSLKEVNENTPPVSPAPPAPPTPPSPEKMIKQMTTAGADFYYNGDKISAKKAKQLFEAKKNLNFMSSEGKDGEKPLVLITDDE